MNYLFCSRILICGLFALAVAACTPKAAAPAATTTTPAQTTIPKPSPDEDLSPCGKFSDAPNPDEAETNYVIYRQMIKAGEPEEAMKTWRKVYATSPAADGRRATVYTDGIAFYNELLQKMPGQREAYGDSILMLYQEARRCYPGDGYMAAIQGFDSYYTYPGSATDDEIYALYYADYQADPNNCDAILTAYSRLRYGGCTEGTAEFDELKQAYEANCRVVASGPSDLKKAFDALEASDYNAAIENFTAAAEGTDDAEKKGRYYMYVSKVYYSHKRNFGQARAFARKAASADPSSGEPYMLIGTLYASSGPLCGPGTGFDSQIVTWPAIDKWQQAKRIDPSLAGKANKLINRYAQYMPSKSDIFSRGIKEGDSFKVGCWIQETTRVRTP